SRFRLASESAGSAQHDSRKKEADSGWQANPQASRSMTGITESGSGAKIKWAGDQEAVTFLGHQPIRS
ncbi:MAG TPA: hypothetical protein VF154_16130, partial [Terriglobales bacterium]